NNIKQVKPFVDSIELLYFEGMKKVDLPTKREIEYINRSDLDYVVHLPIDTKNFKKIENFIKSFNQVNNVKYFIIHIDYNKKAIKFLKYLKDKYKKNILAENYDNKIDNLNKFVRNNIDICLDIGHILHLHPMFIKKFLNKNKNAIKYLHLHGSTGGKDHKSIKMLREDLLLFILNCSIANNITLCVEVFSFNDFIESIYTINRLVKC
ncbi:MAG: hypothetical protein SVN78_09925, partial [Deferribacterota bacterium]|nr:hypothetical protein [Deferribacterota bacterium]